LLAVIAGLAFAMPHGTPSRNVSRAATHAASQAAGPTLGAAPTNVAPPPSTIATTASPDAAGIPAVAQRDPNIAVDALNPQEPSVVTVGDNAGTQDPPPATEPTRSTHSSTRRHTHHATGTHHRTRGQPYHRWSD
jgi:hypothetical protein